MRLEIKNLKEKKITRATLKSFIKKNINDLYVLEKSSFDGMIDCVSESNKAPRKVDPSEVDFNVDRTYGIEGLWTVGRAGGRGGDYFTYHEDEVFVGINVYNCCG